MPDAPEIDLTTVDLVLVPALACDRWGTRLGYGGGYYDRSLNRTELIGCSTVCVVPSACVSPETLPHDAWDRTMGAVVTEAGVQVCGDS